MDKCSIATDSDADYEQLKHEYRQQLLTLEQESTESFDKAVLSLSGGALGLSIAFLKNIKPADPSEVPSLLFWAWICWGLSLIFTLSSFWLSARAMRKAVQQLDDNRLAQERPGGIWDWATRQLTLFGGVCFIVGVGLMIGLIYSNA